MVIVYAGANKLFWIINSKWDTRWNGTKHFYLFLSLKKLGEIIMKNRLICQDDTAIVIGVSIICAVIYIVAQTF